MKLVLLRGCTRAGKSTVLRLLSAVEGIATLEMDAYKKTKYGSAAICNPAIDFPAIGKNAKRLLRDHRAVVVEESFVDKPHVAAVARWAGFDLDSPSLLMVWLDLTLAQAVERKKESPFPRTARATATALSQPENAVWTWQCGARKRRATKSLAGSIATRGDVSGQHTVPQMKKARQAGLSANRRSDYLSLVSL